MSKPALIIGIDFGTTHSGVSWAVNAGAKHIRLITDWPHPESRNPDNQKVPSSISYQKGKPNRWGYAVEHGENSLKWVKVLLETDPRFAEKVALVEKSNRLLQQLDIKADKVVTDYLRFLWQYTHDDIRRFKGDDYESKYDIRVFLTVPAVWSPEAQDRVLSAGKAAGLPPNITPLSEPEAAALYVLRDRVEENDVQIGERFVICDAGGATVDLISYEVVGLNPFSVKEAAIGDGGLCGSIYLDIDFENYIVLLTGKEQYDKLTPLAKRRMIQRDFDSVKRRFSRDGDGDHKYSVELRGVKDDLENGIVDGTIIIERTALQTIFDPIYLKIKELVQYQVSQVKTGVNAVILVGGFGSNKYLQTRLEEEYKGSGVAILTAPNAWSAVSQGAVLWGLEQASDETRSLTDQSSQVSDDSQNPASLASAPQSTMSASISTFSARRVRHSFGVLVVEPFNETEHAAVDREWDSNLKQPVVRHIRWLLKRGDTVRFGDAVEVCLSDIRKIHSLAWNVYASFELLVCEEENPPPTKTPAVRTLCELQTKLPFYKLWNQKWSTSRPPYKLRIELGPAELYFVVTYNGKRVGDVRKDYSLLP